MSDGKKILTIAVSIFSILIVISTATAAPLISKQPIIKRLQEKHTIGSINEEIKKRIDLTGFWELVNQIWKTYIQWTIMICKFTDFLVGHNFMSTMLAGLLYTIIMPIPLLILTLIDSVVVVPYTMIKMICNLFGIEDVSSIEDLVHKFGLVGCFLGFCAVLPVSILIIPFVMVGLFFYNIVDLWYEATGMIWN